LRNRPIKNPALNERGCSRTFGRLKLSREFVKSQAHRSDQALGEQGDSGFQNCFVHARSCARKKSKQMAGEGGELIVCWRSEFENRTKV